MWYLYLDESGDLGFDFFDKSPSRFFTIAILLVKGEGNHRVLIKAIKKTIRRRLRRGRILELKGSRCSFDVKQYFYKQVSQIPFELYALTLNKRRVYDYLTYKKDIIYNYLAQKVLDRISFESAPSRIMLIVDKSKGKREIGEFNQYIVSQLKIRVDPLVPVDVYHYTSHETACLQAVDMFAWGIFRKYEHRDVLWYNVFREKIVCEERYL